MAYASEGLLELKVVKITYIYIFFLVLGHEVNIRVQDEHISKREARNRGE